MCELLHLAEKSATWELENTIIKSRPTPAHARGTPKACERVRELSIIMPVGAIVADLPAHTGWGDKKGWVAQHISLSCF